MREGNQVAIAIRSGEGRWVLKGGPLLQVCSRWVTGAMGGFPEEVPFRRREELAGYRTEGRKSTADGGNIKVKASLWGWSVCKEIQTFVAVGA